jgi:peptidyl-dipeptidase A
MLRIGISLLALTLASPALAQNVPPAKPAPGDASLFVDKAEAALAKASVDANRANWVNATYINDDTDAIAAEAAGAQSALQVQYGTQASKYLGVTGLKPDVGRKLGLLRSKIVQPAPSRPGAAETLSGIVTTMQGRYGAGKGTLDGKPINGSDIEAAMGTERDPDKLKEMWVSWHDNVGAPQRTDFLRLVGLSNQGARELGYADTGALWRSVYDMPPEEFAKEIDRLWGEVKPLYDSLFTYVRWKLNEKYGDKVQSKTGPIRADLLGNMWAQEWGNIYDIVAPPGAGDIGYDTGKLLEAKGYDPIKMVKTGEGFYSSLGFKPLPDSFWARSQFVKPADREVVCHASAWDIDDQSDVRVKMCLKVNSDDFVTVHHELGHNYYQRAYSGQPYLFKDGANDGFHEAIGDFVALSITPDYLVSIGLLDADKVPTEDKDIGLLLRQALDKVAFLPFGLLVDKWRWGVFSGSIRPDGLETAWNDLRLQYQGVVPPVARDESKFDPGAKYHVPANVPYARYFLARILQFQFYKAACEQAGWKGPLHRCSFYGNKDVGAKLDAMLTMGASKPWPDALEAFTGTREMSGKAIVEYFAPLKDWLDEQNKGKPTGW